MHHAPGPLRADRRRLVLWRHGRTEWNVQDRAQGHADIPLDPVGREQARRAARALATLAPAFIWSSDLQRARGTARELAALTGLEVVEDARLREYHVGIRQGTTFAEFRRSHPEVYARFLAEADYRVPGAELPAEVEARMTAVLRDAAGALGPGSTAVLVGHGAALRSGVLAFFEAPFRLRNMLAPLENCAWTVLEEHAERGWQIADYNARTVPHAGSALADEMPPHRGAVPGPGTP
ncbi:histidine phosphatase family protein [Citricoccus sp. SGAir0253]|uniref:histidine phosphatase family protein n=1 Tax=Citricoccus sp. SGAir0253 TaxID=2567881 RepID=UPI0010CCEE5D|nr:histidine phosphatase family protein [Citricoccus sp. SGAir0253]QCU76829.1 histidine phosphatase family protein [Citricoccus sp. SGAir0253]